MGINSYTSSSKKKKYTFLKLIIFIILFSVIIYYIGEYYEKISNKNKNSTEYKMAWEEFYDLPKDSLDLIFIGSSHSYCSFDPELIDEDLGTNSFNFGSPLQYADSSYHVFKEVLKYQKPKAMVFEIYWGIIENGFDLNQADIVINAIDRKDFELDFIMDAFPPNEIGKYLLKPVRYQKDAFNYWNKNLKEKLEEKLEEDKEAEVTEVREGVSYHKGKGFIYSDQVITEEESHESNHFKGFDGRKWDFDSGQKVYIERMVELARENDIEVVFVTAPIANVSMDYIQNYDALHDKIADFASGLDVDYRDYNIVNMEKNLLENENFRDNSHLNYSGVEIFTEDFTSWYENRN